MIVKPVILAVALALAALLVTCRDRAPRPAPTTKGADPVTHRSEPSAAAVARGIPPIDADAPANVSTATFALG